MKKLEVYRKQTCDECVKVESVEALKEVNGQEAFTLYGVVLLIVSTLVGNTEKKEATFFFEGGYFSNFQDSPFTVGGFEFQCVEQFFQCMKMAFVATFYLAVDELLLVKQTMAAIMAASCPKYMQSVSRNVGNLRDWKAWQIVWFQNNESILKYGVSLKIQNHEEIKEFVKTQTKNCEIVNFV